VTEDAVRVAGDEVGEGAAGVDRDRQVGHDASIGAIRTVMSVVERSV
jgi:hypothetical protein